MIYCSICLIHFVVILAASTGKKVLLYTFRSVPTSCQNKTDNEIPIPYRDTSIIIGQGLSVNVKVMIYFD